MTDGLVAVVLAAGQGTRMRPLTDRTPKPLLTVGNRSLLELAFERAAAVLTEAGADPDTDLAVNAHHLADQIAAAARRLRPGVEVSEERGRLLGTAGALGRLKFWIAGRAVLVVNSDVFSAAPPAHFLDGWTGQRARLLVQDVGAAADFGTHRFLGVSVVPADQAARLTAEPSGLYGLIWKKAWAAGDLELVEHGAAAFDCGTPPEFLTANFAATGARTVVAPDAVVDGTIDLSVILPGGRVSAGEHLVGAVRDRFGQTAFADPASLVAPEPATGSVGR